MPATEMPPPAGDCIVLFDGECGLCSAAVQFWIERDPRARLRFASLHSPVAQDLLAARGATPLPDSIVLLERGRLHLRSSAALRIARVLRFPWPLLAILLLVPRPLRDRVYDLVARRRHRWRGRTPAACVASPALRARFLDAGC